MPRSGHSPVAEGTREAPQHGSRGIGPERSDRRRRLLYEDLCDSPRQPRGSWAPVASGIYTWDPIRRRRILGGGVAALTFPPFPLYGPYTLEVIHSNLGSRANGTLQVGFYRLADGLSPVNGKYQNDGNVVAYSAAVAWAASGTTTAAIDTTGHHHHSVVAIDDESKNVSMSLGYPPMGGGVGGTSNPGHTASCGGNYVYPGTLNAGDMCRAVIETTSTRQVALYLVRLWRGFPV